MWHFFSTTAIASTQNGVFIVAGFRSAAISTLPPLKHIYGDSFMSHHYRTPQKTIPIAAVPKKRRNRPYVQWQSQKMPQ